MTPRAAHRKLHDGHFLSSRLQERKPYVAQPSQWNLFNLRERVRISLTDRARTPLPIPHRAYVQSSITAQDLFPGGRTHSRDTSSAGASRLRHKRDPKSHSALHPAIFITAPMENAFASAGHRGGSITNQTSTAPAISNPAHASFSNISFVRCVGVEGCPNRARAAVARRMVLRNICSLNPNSVLLAAPASASGPTTRRRCLRSARASACATPTKFSAASARSAPARFTHSIASSSEYRSAA